MPRRLKFSGMKRRGVVSQLPPEGTDEELMEAFNVAESYLYKILSYADKEEVIPKEELDKERRIFQFVKQGPKAASFRFTKHGKLTSADVLYFLSTTQSADRLSETYGVSATKIRAIRRGDSPDWHWEYLFVRRLKAILKGIAIKSDATEFRTHRIYSISHRTTPSNIEILYYTTSLLKAKKLRQGIIKEKEYDKMVKEGTLDIIYPIDRILVMK